VVGVTILSEPVGRFIPKAGMTGQQYVPLTLGKRFGTKLTVSSGMDGKQEIYGECISKRCGNTCGKIAWENTIRLQRRYR